MKKFLITLACGVLLATAGSAFSYTLSGGTDIGELDKYVAKANLANSDEKAELDWVNSVLNPSVATFKTKYDELELSSWQPAEGFEDIYAYNLGNNGAFYDYFLVKLGNNNGTNFTDYLFENVDNIEWAVLDINNSFDGTGISGTIEKISHISLFDSGSTPVPEPSTFLMLGAGILGLGLYGRRRVKK